VKTALGLVALGCCACGRGSKPTAAFPIQKVCATEIAKLEGELRAREAASEPPADLRARVRDLVIDRAHADARMRALELEDLRSIGEPAVRILDELFDEKGHDREVRLSALEALGAIDTESAADALVKRIDLEKVKEPWVRAQSAFQVSHLSTDHVLPRLLMQLKYETDGETVIWIAQALAQHRNYAGLEGLRVLSVRGATHDVQVQAQSMLAKIAEDTGFADGESLDTAWSSPDPHGRVPCAQPSLRLRLEMWRCIANLAEFDLRKVDDARFALSHSASWVVDLLVAALHEESPHSRVHVAQSLERMGGRAHAACSELVVALNDPSAAAGAAAALGAIGCTDAIGILEADTQPGNDPELRNAAAAALGRLGSPTAIPILRSLLEPNEPTDLRQTAAQSLVELVDGRSAVPLLIDCLTALGADAFAAEGALESWLARTAQSEGEVATAARAALSEWKAAAGDSSRTPTAEEALSRQRARAEVLRRSLDALLGAGARTDATARLRR
jgi:HEAT repeat protein